MLEYEKKILLTKEEYEVLVQQFKNIPKKIQINYYFDTEDLSMNKRGVTCRTRFKNGKYKTTIKRHCSDRLNCSIEEELCETTEINVDVFNALDLCFQGELVTSRICLYKDASFEVVLDWNIYLGISDYELEVEYDEENEKNAMDCLKDIVVHLIAAQLVDSFENFVLRVGKGKSKSERFFERKQKKEERQES